MKYLILILVTLPIVTYGQIWVKPNATWYYKFTDVSSSLAFGYLKVSHTKDTLINNINCMTFSTTKYLYNEDQFGDVHLISETIIDSNYTYTTGDTVFYWKNNQFEILYNFSKNTGESWIVNSENTQIGDCDGFSTANVLTDDYTTISGNQYRLLDIYSPNTSYWRMRGTYNSRFGNQSTTDIQYNFLFPLAGSCFSDISDDTPKYHFYCFRDDELDYNPSGGLCGNIVSVSEIIKDFNNFQISPNPVIGNTIHIKSRITREGVVSIKNTVGNEIYKQEVILNKGSNDILLPNVVGGVYFVTINYIDDQHTYFKKIIIA